MPLRPIVIFSIGVASRAAAQHDVEAIAQRKLGARCYPSRSPLPAGCAACSSARAVEDRVVRQQRIAGEVHLRHQGASRNARPNSERWICAGTPGHC